MNFRITGLSAHLFQPLFGLSDAELAIRGAKRYAANSKPGFPDRIEIRDAEIGESLILINFTHQPAANAFRASHAIFVSENSSAAYDRVGEVPQALRLRAISLRAFDSADMLVDADLLDGQHLETGIERLLCHPQVAYLQAHYAKPGCYAARIERASSL
jgi:Protein of unknown function (DUF1203)